MRPAKRRDRGHAMLELAISASVMVTCLVGTFQFGYTFYVYNQLVTAVGIAPGASWSHSPHNWFLVTATGGYFRPMLTST